MKAKAKTKQRGRKAVAVAEDTVLVLRTCNADMSSHGGFVWPASGPIEAPDWKPLKVCGFGLHGLLWGEGDGSLLNFAPDAKGLVVRVPANSIVDLDGKVKFPAGVVEFCGDLKSAAIYIGENGAAGRAIVRGTATAGYRGTATAGYGGTATAGDRGTATAGYRGTATAGPGGVICLTYWNGKRYKARIAHIKDVDGDGELEPDTPYRLNEHHEFVAVAVEKKAA